MNIKIDYKNIEIKDDLGNSIEFNKDNFEKASLQSNGVFLDKDLKWNKSIHHVMNILRVKRDSKIREIDYYFLSDTTKLSTSDYKSFLKAKRQEFRDITVGVETIEQALSKIKYINDLVL